MRRALVASLWLSWEKNVSLSASDGQVVVTGHGSRIALRPVDPQIVAALERLAPPGEDEGRLSESVLAAGTVESLACWYYHVNHLRQRGLICRSLYCDGALLATFSPLCRAARQTSQPGVDRGPAAVKDGQISGTRSRSAVEAAPVAYVLSRFAYLRRVEDKLVVESPLAMARVVLHDLRVVSILGALATATTLSQLAERVDLVPADTRAFVSLLQEAGLVEQVTADEVLNERSADGGSTGQQNDSALDSWEFHDLLFHSRSRRGRSDGRFGGTYRLARRPSPAVKPNDPRQGYDLYRPDMDQLERDDLPFALVQQRRRSIRSYGNTPISARELGEFLYRVGRVTRHWRSDAETPSGPVNMDFTARPYPAGGGLYELEFYVAVRACGDLEPGLYHYDPEQHRLNRICGPAGDCAALLDDAGLSAGILPDTLQVLVILAARFDRIAWKYESIAYSLILKDVGVLYQTMYLAATAMNLAPCALGCGDSDLFARAAETDYFVESSVGEFLLGSIGVLT